MKKIVLVPVKNEEWILDTFLKTCSLFADHIILADQNSTDRSVEIASRYEKVIIIKNKDNHFNEAERQVLLIDKARELFGLGNLLLALDADEVISADSLSANGWKRIEEAPSGTVFLFDKPTPFFDKPFALRYKQGFPLGYKDDGAEHNPNLIHSTRVPTPSYASQIMLDDIMFLHLCFVRTNIQFSKNRYYCVLENISKNSSVRVRQSMYSYYLPNDYASEILEDVRPEWYAAYSKMGIDLRNFQEQEYYYMDFEVLKIFNQYGYKRFYFDPVWRFDWEKCMQAGIQMGISGLPLTPVKKPPAIFLNAVDIVFKSIRVTIGTIRRITSKFKTPLGTKLSP